MKTKSMVLTLILLLITNLSAADWPTWRGINHDGISTESGWNPKAIEKVEKAWEIQVGLGYAIVSVVNGKVYTMGNTDETNIIYCLDEKTGKEIWKHSYASGNTAFEGTRGTPIFDNGKIYTTGQLGHVTCHEAETGKVIWKRNLLTDYKTDNISWGISSSPIIEGDILLLNLNKSGVALNKNTGKDIWVSESADFSYATPMIYEMNDKKYAAIFSQETMFSVDIETGKVAWEYPWKTSWDINGADPIFFDNKMFLSSGYKVGCALLDLTNNQPKEIWSNKNISAQFGSCVKIGDYIYGPKGDCGRKTSGLACIDAKTGEMQWEANLGFSSLIVVDNKLVIVTETGNLHIAEVNPKEYKEIAQANVIDADKKNPVWCAPVLANKRIYIRNHQGTLVSLKVD